MNYLDTVAERVKNQLDPALRPNTDDDVLYRLYALLVLVKGECTSLENVHDAWSTWMTPRQPNHAALVPFASLTKDQQEQDRPYLEAILRVARRSHSGKPKDQYTQQIIDEDLESCGEGARRDLLDGEK